MGQIHKFQTDGMLLLLDVNSSTVYTIDEITYKVLDFYKVDNKNQIVDKLKTLYSEESINEVLEELEELENKQLLYSPGIYEDTMHKLGKERVIKAMCLYMTHSCNLRCKYCFASESRMKCKSNLMSFETGKKALDFLAQHSGKRKNLDIDFFGGEPLLNFQVVKKLVGYGRLLQEKHNKKIRFTLTTNAVSLNDGIMEFLNENMDNIVLSLDGRKEVNDAMRRFPSGEGTYEHIVPKIKAAVQKRGHRDYYVRGTYTSMNLDFSKDVLQLAEMGIRNISVEPVVEDKDKEYALKEKHLMRIFKEYEKLAQLYLDRNNRVPDFNFFHFMIDLDEGPCVLKTILGCGAGAEYICIAPEGDIYPCHQFVGYKEFKMGNIYNGLIYRIMKKNFTGSNILTRDECRNCWARFYCGGGCAANAYRFNKNIDKPYKLSCELLKKRLECALYIKAKLSEGG